MSDATNVASAIAMAVILHSLFKYGFGTLFKSRSENTKTGSKMTLELVHGPHAVLEIGLGMPDGPCIICVPVRHVLSVEYTSTGVGTVRANGGMRYAGMIGQERINAIVKGLWEAK